MAGSLDLLADEAKRQYDRYCAMRIPDEGWSCSAIKRDQEGYKAFYKGVIADKLRGLQACGIRDRTKLKALEARFVVGGEMCTNGREIVDTGRKIAKDEL